MKIPDIKVQLIHIDGPLKGEINEFCQPIIALGRHPESQVVFPEKCTAISREHARIIREGNRFKLVDHSTNGTLVNGKQQKETFLQDGDVLLIGGKGGAKVSFLTQKISPEEAAIFELAVEEEKQEQIKKPAPSAPPGPLPEEVRPTPVPVKPQVPTPTVAKTFTIQYGATLNSFKKLPITIGSSSDCDLTLAHPDLLERHAQIFFQDNQYWVKDLTGRRLLTVNMLPVESESALTPDAHLNLTPNGPEFTFLGEGRLVEVEKKEPKQASTPVKHSKPPAINKSQRSKLSLTVLIGGKNTILWIIVSALGLVLALAVWLIL